MLVDHHLLFAFEVKVVEAVPQQVISMLLSTRTHTTWAKAASLHEVCNQIIVDSASIGGYKQSPWQSNPQRKWSRWMESWNWIQNTPNGKRCKMPAFPNLLHRLRHKWQRQVGQYGVLSGSCRSWAGVRVAGLLDSHVSTRLWFFAHHIILKTFFISISFRNIYPHQMPLVFQW